MLLLASHFTYANALIIQEVHLYKADKTYFLSANIGIDLALDSAPLQALNNGVPLYFILEIKLLSKNWLGILQQDTSIIKEYRLFYHSIARQYILVNSNNNTSSFSDISAALQNLGEITALPIINKETLKKNKDYKVKLRMYLNLSKLPLPLRAYAYLSNNWFVKSQWSIWDL